MAIPVEQRTLDIVKKLNRLVFRRNLDKNELRIETEYTTGYDGADGSFVPLEGEINMFGPYESRWILQRTIGQTGLPTSATIGQLIVTVFDALESGQVVIPPDPDAPVEEPL